MSKNIVFEGWLTKSPPSKRIWKTKWRRRWFALRQSGELPGQYFLDYYADRNCRRLKGTINLDFCEQVDAGLHMERSSNGSLDPKLRGSVFTIQTQIRTYHLEADCEADMEKWVDAICRVCGLRATDDTSGATGIYQNNSVANNHENIPMRAMGEQSNSSNKRTASNAHYKNSTLGLIDQNQPLVRRAQSVAMNEDYEHSDGTGPYIPISECITGVRSLDTQRAFTFDPKNIVTSIKTPFEKSSENQRHHYVSHPQIRVNNIDLSENESNISDEECRSLNTSQSNIGEWPFAKSFKKLSLVPHRSDELREDGPPVPPRPPKTFAMSRDLHYKDTFQGPRVQEPVEIHASGASSSGAHKQRRMSHGTSPCSPGRSSLSHSYMRTTDDEDECSMGHSIQYCNLMPMPPAVDRALKPRYSSHSIGNVHSLSGQMLSYAGTSDEGKDVLQYLDLDLQPSKTSPSKDQEVLRKSTTVIHGKSASSSEAESAYKTVDFLKTEAFNITRQDAEASRSNQQ